MGEDIKVYFRDEELVAWLRSQVKSGRFRSFSHAVERSVQEMRQHG